MNESSTESRTELLAKFEYLIEEQLPEDYRSYLLRGHTRLATPIVAQFVGVDRHKNSTSVCALFDLSPAGPSSVTQNYIFYVKSGRIKNGYVPIAEDVGGNLLCLGLKSEKRGNVFFWDHELEDIDTEDNQAKVCSTFTELLTFSNTH